MSAKDTFITISHGIITLHTGNDGHSFLTRGPEATEHVVSLDYLKGTRHYEEARKALEKHKKTLAKA